MFQTRESIILKKWTYFFDSSALGAILAFPSLNKLGPLVANFKTDKDILCRMVKCTFDQRFILLTQF